MINWNLSELTRRNLTRKKRRKTTQKLISKSNFFPFRLESFKNKYLTGLSCLSIFVRERSRKKWFSINQKEKKWRENIETCFQISVYISRVRANKCNETRHMCNNAFRYMKREIVPEKNYSPRLLVCYFFLIVREIFHVTFASNFSVTHFTEITNFPR